jgi:signal transduction histidine kinase/CheY-like chemotaxis protein
MDKPSDAIRTADHSTRHRSAAQLVVLQGRGRGSRFRIQESATVGRSPHATIMLDDPSVSRLHARLSRNADGVWIIEDRSRNGTFINGQRVKQHPLILGDQIRCGPIATLEFRALDAAEGHAVERQRFEAIGRVGVGIAHDLKNLLAAMDASVAFIQELPAEQPLGDAEVQACVGDISLALARASEISRSVVSFARGRGTDRRCVELAPLIADVVRMLRHALDRSVRVEISTEPHLAVYASKSELHQVLLNLCLNARDAMPEGGVLRIEARALAATPSQGPWQQGQPLALLSVTDSGAGMDIETQRHAFEPFFTTKLEGSGFGLGLATVRDIVGAHGGEIGVESSPGQGSTFTLRLPRLDSNPASLSSTAEHEPPPVLSVDRSLVHILLVDDEQILRRSVARRLKQAGFLVTEASDGAGAVAVYRPGVHVLVLLDLDMPGVDGERAQVELLARDPDARIVFVTGYVDPERAAAMLDRGALAVLEKPLNLDSLVHLAHQVLTGSPFVDSETTASG